MRVSVEGGKYTYVITETNAHVLRYGELWKDATGDKFTYSMAAEIESLREQVEKLTKELSVLKTTPPHLRQDLHCVASDLSAQVRERDEQLTAALAACEKMRKVLLRLACLGNGDQYGNSIGNCIAQEALSLPDLASPVLNRIRAEAMEEENEAIIAAANALENIASTSSSTRIRRVANDALTAIRARRK